MHINNKRDAQGVTEDRTNDFNRATDRSDRLQWRLIS